MLCFVIPCVHVSLTMSRKILLKRNDYTLQQQIIEMLIALSSFVLMLYKLLVKSFNPLAFFKSLLPKESITFTLLPVM